MARPLDEDELIERWTLPRDEVKLLARKRGATRLGFAPMVRFFADRGRFPGGLGEIPENALDYVARQVDVNAGAIGGYDWDGRQIKRHRVEIRQALGFRECTVADAEKLTEWLAVQVCERERDAARVRDEVLVHCRDEGIEPPTRGRIDRIVGSALRRAEEALTGRIHGRLDRATRRRLDTLVAEVDDEQDEDGSDVAASVWASFKAEAGAVGVNTVIDETAKIEALRAVRLPAGLFADVDPKVVAGWRQRAAVESPSLLRAHPDAVKRTLLASFVWRREREVTDALVDLLIRVVHRVGARAEDRVTEELINDLKRVRGKEGILFGVAEAAVAEPDGIVRDVVFPVVGEETLADLVREHKAAGTTYRRTVQKTLKASYTNHYRRGLMRLLDVLEFRSNNRQHQPVIEALALLGRYSGRNVTYYDFGETVPVDGVVRDDWRELLYRTDKRAKTRIVRTVHEICVWQALRERLRCKEIWVVGAEKWQNPDDDLPADFDDRRLDHYAKLNKPLDPDHFVAELQDELRTELALLNDAVPDLDWLQISDRRSGAIKLTPLDAEPEPTNLRHLKGEVERRWGTVGLLDILKEADLRIGFTRQAVPVGTREMLPREVLQQRILLTLYAYGTNAGLRHVAHGDHDHSEDDLRYCRRRYLTVEAARRMAIEIANATFAARSADIWGTSTTVASDSTHFAAYDQNLLTEYHRRYGQKGILIYWHVDHKSMAIHSQLLSCTASEVHAMVEGAMRHGTDLDVDGNYVDTHGSSLIGWGITRLLNFELLARIKGINRIKLNIPSASERDAYPNLTPALTRAARWDVIGTQYDPMVKYATAIRVGTASTEAILRRFTRANNTHPVYQAMLELGRVQRSIFVCRYLRLRELQREINAGLNVTESFNGANAHIHYGNGGGFTTNRRDEQELGMLCLHILQVALVYVNTLLIQDILADATWKDRLGVADYRGLCPLFWGHCSPYGRFDLDMTSRILIPSAPDRRLSS